MRNYMVVYQIPGRKSRRTFEQMMIQKYGNAPDSLVSITNGSFVVKSDIETVESIESFILNRVDNFRPHIDDNQMILFADSLRWGVCEIIPQIDDGIALIGATCASM